MKNLRKIIIVPKMFSNYTFDHNLVPNYKPQGISKTNPDVGLSIYDIINKFTRGMSVPQHIQSSNMGYSPIDMSKYDKMDKFEKLDVAMRIKHDIARAELNLQKQKSEEAKLREAQLREEEIDKRASEKVNDILKANQNAT